MVYSCHQTKCAFGVAFRVPGANEVAPGMELGSKCIFFFFYLLCHRPVRPGKQYQWGGEKLGKKITLSTLNTTSARVLTRTHGWWFPLERLSPRSRGAEKRNTHRKKKKKKKKKKKYAYFKKKTFLFFLSVRTRINRHFF
jgi:hypothetical protein